MLFWSPVFGRIDSERKLLVKCRACQSGTAEYGQIFHICFACK